MVLSTLHFMDWIESERKIVRENLFDFVVTKGLLGSIGSSDSVNLGQFSFRFTSALSNYDARFTTELTASVLKVIISLAEIIIL